MVVLRKLASSLPILAFVQQTVHFVPTVVVIRGISVQHALHLITAAPHSQLRVAEDHEVLIVDHPFVHFRVAFVGLLRQSVAFVVGHRYDESALVENGPVAQCAGVETGHDCIFGSDNAEETGLFIDVLVHVGGVQRIVSVEQSRAEDRFLGVVLDHGDESEFAFEVLLEDVVSKK